MQLIQTDADVETGLRALLRKDPRLAAVLSEAGPIPLRRTSPGFAGLASIIVSQMISKASAAAIWARMEAGWARLRRWPWRSRARRSSGGWPVPGQEADARGPGRGRARRADRSRCSMHAGCACRRRAPVCAARHRPLDRRGLSALLRRACRYLSVRRRRPAGGGGACSCAPRAPGPESHGSACGRLGTVAKCRGTAFLGLLCGRHAAQRRPAAGGFQPLKRGQKANAMNLLRASGSGFTILT